MKKVFLVVSLLFLLVGCRGEVDLVGNWSSSDNSRYIFREDGTCTKYTNVNFYECTYTKSNGVVDIHLQDGTMESGQINPDRIIIGSDVYKKGE